ncbi:MAG: hypothetical protein A07HN63_01938 [uncultured archaeon A07HN63]|nr:MAG: hypothetical protein A07HN63_01938 [uncultured archaeon A07HN63]
MRTVQPTQRTVRETVSQLAGAVGTLAVGALVVDRLVAVPEFTKTAATRAADGTEMMAETTAATEGCG